jgi:hypothetical protein
MFSDEFRQRLASGKYTRWAVNLTEPQLAAVLWMVGEYGYRAPVVLKPLKRHRDEVAWNDVAFARARLALETLFRMVAGDRPDLDEAIQRVGKVLAQVRSVAEEGIKPPPGERPAERWPVRWRGHLVGWVDDLVPEVFGCTGRWVAADSLAVAEFLAAAGGTSSGTRRVEVGGIQGLVDRPPDESGRVLFYWWFSPHG